MQRSLSLWTLAGALVAFGWMMFAASHPMTIFSGWWMLADITCPPALLRQLPLTWYLVIILNAATYALIGAGINFMHKNRLSIR